jgi:hypothetical protein
MFGENRLKNRSSAWKKPGNGNEKPNSRRQGGKIIVKIEGGEIWVEDGREETQFKVQTILK